MGWSTGMCYKETLANKLKKKKKEPAQYRGVIPCALIILSGIALVSLLFYGMLKSSGK
jgi:hypothetical protein